MHRILILLALLFAGCATVNDQSTPLTEKQVAKSIKAIDSIGQNSEALTAKVEKVVLVAEERARTDYYRRTTSGLIKSNENIDLYTDQYYNWFAEKFRDVNCFGHFVAGLFSGGATSCLKWEELDKEKHFLQLESDLNSDWGDAVEASLQVYFEEISVGMSEIMSDEEFDVLIAGLSVYPSLELRELIAKNRQIPARRVGKAGFKTYMLGREIKDISYQLSLSITHWPIRDFRWT